MLIVQKKISFLVVLVLIIFAVSGCSTDVENLNNEPISRTNFFLGTVVTVRIYDNPSDEVFNKIFDRIKEIEDKMTINKDNSEVVQINSKAGIDFTNVSDETFDVIKRGKYFSEISEGKFDISIGPLVKLWNIGTEEARVPSQDEINSMKYLVDYRNIFLNDADKSVMLKEDGMILDLGGIAKGYAADEIVNILKNNKVNHAIINLGGNVFAYGSKPDGSHWKVGIQNPVSSKGEYIGVVNVVNQTVVTSGVYERFFEKKGKRYHHILDPDTGYPIENTFLGISIIAENSIDADALSTSAFSLGLDEGIKFIEKLEDVEAIFITKESKVYITLGLEDKFRLTDTNFELAK